MSTQRRLAVLGCALALALASAGCRSARAPARTPSPGADVQREVWAALIRHAYVRETTEVVVLEPGLIWGVEELGSRPKSAPPDAWRALLAALKRGGQLPRDLDPGRPVAWLSSEAWRQLPEGSGIEGRWEAFHERFPHGTGHISLSRIGFSRDGKTAVVHGWVGSGMLSASGDIFVLRRTASGWKVVDTINFAMA